MKIYLFMRCAMVAIIVVIAKKCEKLFFSGTWGGGDLNNQSGYQPDFILFLADDLSYWDISCLGQKEFPKQTIAGIWKTPDRRHLKRKNS